MRVLAYVPQYVGYGRNAGAELTLHELLYALRLRGHHILVQLSGPTEAKEPYVIDGIKVQPYGSKQDLIFQTLDCNLIITHLHAAERATIVGNLRKIPTVQYVHNSHVTTQQAVQCDPSLVVFNTEWIREEFPRRYQDIVVHPAVRPSAYATSRGKAVTLINLWRNKGVSLFYELARRNPEVPFLGVLGGYEHQVVEDLPNVTIMENQDDIREAYRRTKVLLMPSAYESYGRVAVEAAASGIPTIASPTQGLREALGPRGIFVDSPSTNIPGGNPGPWTDAQVDAWDKELNSLLKPARYGKQSKLALERSAEVWSETESELTKFCEAVERLV